MSLFQHVDWILYEEVVLDAVQKALTHFAHSRPSLEGKKIYQISIWTDVDGTTAISFETLEHAEKVNQESAAYFVSVGEFTVAQEVQALAYNVNPAEFEFSRIYSLTHPDIEQLQDEVAFTLEEKEKIEAQVEHHLLRVAQQIQSNSILTNMLVEAEVWLGISSPRDWYDHVTKIIV